MAKQTWTLIDTPNGVYVDTLNVSAGDVAGELLLGAHGTRAVVNAVTPTALRLAPSLLISDDDVDTATELIAAAVGAV